LIRAALVLVSAGILAYEVLLIRLFSIVQWHHFTYMVISIALLGFGASGTFLALTREWLLPRFAAAFAVSAALFGLTAFLGYVTGQVLPFNAPALIWEPRQLFFLLGLYLIFLAPFFFGATCIGLSFLHYRDRIGQIYAVNLIGSAAGSIGVVALLFFLDPVPVLKLVTCLALLGALLTVPRIDRRRAKGFAAALSVGTLITILALPSTWTDLRPSPYKALPRALEVPGTRVVGTHSNPLGYLNVVESREVPLRHAPGLSLNNRQSPPAQLGIFTDANALSVITAFDGDLAPLTYLDFTTSALPYHLLASPRVLIIGAGGGAPVLQALYHRAARVDAIEVNPDLISLVRKHHRDFAGDLYDRPEVRAHVREARSFLAQSDERWDLIQLSLIEGGGGGSLGESYLFTVEAVQDYVRHLQPGALVAISGWAQLPPRSGLKLFATALEALRREGVAEPAGRLALIRGWSTTTLLIKNGAFTAADAERIRAFAAARSFDLAFLDDLKAVEVNRFNQMAEPFFYQGAKALAGDDAADFVARYKFDIAPSLDDRPFFHDFFKWRSLPEFLERSARGAGFLEWGYPILAATLAQAFPLSLVLILLPLWLWHKRGTDGEGKARAFTYFAALGLGFLFIEIAFIQRFILFLGTPLYAAAVVIAGFLFFAGLGSALSARMGTQTPQDTGPAALPGRRAAVVLFTCLIAVLSLAYLFVLPVVFAQLIALGELARIVIALALIAPLAFCMGLPFPLGLAELSDARPRLVPWAWGVSGCASVMGAVLAQVLAIHFGFTAVVLVAALIYVVAAVAFTWPATSKRPAA
jgi:spermidine synthase